MKPEDWTPTNHPRYARTSAVRRFVTHYFRPVGKNFFDNWDKSRVIWTNSHRLFDVADLIRHFTEEMSEIEKRTPDVRQGSIKVVSPQRSGLDIPNIDTDYDKVLAVLSKAAKDLHIKVNTAQTELQLPNNFRERKPSCQVLKTRTFLVKLRQ